MQDATDEALLLLYWACRRNTDFPGQLPDESVDVTPQSILEGLGLVGPTLDDVGSPDVPKSATHPLDSQTMTSTSSQSITALSNSDTDRKVFSPDPLRVSQSPQDQRPNASIFTSSGPPTPTEMEMDMCGQFVHITGSRLPNELSGEQKIDPVSRMPRILPPESGERHLDTRAIVVSRQELLQAQHVILKRRSYKNPLPPESGERDFRLFQALSRCH